MRNGKKDQQMRQRIAMAAARIMADEGVRDFYVAKRKAAERLGATDTHNMPRNGEIEEALAEYQRLFQSDTQPRRLRDLREAALQAMQVLDGFEPRLVGPVLNGTAGQHAEVELHAFSDVPEEVAFRLMDRHIPFETGEKRLRHATGEATTVYPSFNFLAGDITIDVTVFPLNGLRQAPRGPVDGKPMRRAGLGAVRELLAEA